MGMFIVFFSTLAQKQLSVSLNIAGLYVMRFLISFIYCHYFQFAPTYHDYVLYNNGTDNGTNDVTKYRSRTFVPTGPEMDIARKSKPDLLDEIQLSSVPKSDADLISVSSAAPNQVDLEAIKSSLLKESAANASRPYDLSVLVDTDLSNNYPTEVPAVVIDLSKQ
jgi:hypothetical protein